jgi:hypothetical protein
MGWAHRVARCVVKEVLIHAVTLCMYTRPQQKQLPKAIQPDILSLIAIVSFYSYPNLIIFSGKPMQMPTLKFSFYPNKKLTIRSTHHGHFCASFILLYTSFIQ